MKHLIQIQNRLKAPKDKYNSFGKYSYRSAEGIMEAVKPLLKEFNCLLTVSDEVVLVGDWHYVEATATFMDVEEGWQISVKASAREEPEKKGMDASQITGTASSYARKYALNGLFLIDDNKDADTDEYHEITSSDPKPSKKKAKSSDDDSSLVGKKAKLRSMLTVEQYQMMEDKFGDIVLWSEEQVDKWLKQMEEKNA